MAERSVIINLTARVGSYISDMARARQSTEDLGRSQDRTGQASEQAGSRFSRLAASADQNREAWDKAGGALTGFGVGMVAALGASAKAAMDWESAWAGVTKTVDGSPEEMAALEDGLRGLAKTLPITHTEIAGVAEAAGQLGVAREDVLGFTKTMVDLGVSTNLTAEDAATDIAQISNVMGTMSREGSMGVARFGSALVALGNDGASTEKEILSMAQRIAGAGATVGATEVEVLALSNTLASMGIRAELGGGVTTRVLLKMFTAVKEGGETLDSFASTAGVSADEFSKAYSESPVEALNMVAQGLDRVNKDGGNVVQVMKDMGIKGTEEVQVMLSLANSGTLLADSLALGASSWEENSALVEEATKRYDTADSRIRVAWNNIKDAAISAGAVLLPVISTMADGIASLAGWFGDLPAPVQGALTVVGGLVGVTALLAGSFLVLFPRVVDTIGAFRTLGVTGGGLTGGMKKLGAALGIAGVALAAAGALKALHNSMEPAVASTGEMTQALMKLKGNSSSLDDMFANIDFKSGGAVLTQIDSVGEAIARLNSNTVNDNIGQWANDAMGIDNDFSKLEDTLNNVDLSMAGMVGSGNLGAAAAGFKSIAESAKAQGIGLDQLEGHFPGYLDALRQTASTAGETVEDAELLNWALGETPQVMLDAAGASEETAAALGGVASEAEAAVVPLEDIVEALFALGMISMSSRDSTAAFHESLRAMGEATLAAQNGTLGLGAVLNETATDFELTTEAGAAANAAFQDIAQKGMADVEAKAREGLGQEELQANLDTTYQSLLTAADGMGIVGDDAINLARDVLGVPDGVDINTWMSDAARKMAGDTTAELDKIDGRVVTATAILNEFTNRLVTESLTRLRTGDTSTPTPAAPGPWLPPKAKGGRINYPAPSDLRQDNVLGMVNDRPIALQGQEWIINGASSSKYDKELAAINAGTFAAGMPAPGREYAAPPASNQGSRGEAGLTIDMPITINGATDVNAVRQAVVGDITYLFQKNGVRLGK